MLNQLAVATMACSAILLAVTAPAQAEGITITDKFGDTIDPGLDITGFTVSNRDRAVVIDFEFKRDRRGEVIVAVDFRHGPGAVLVSQHPRRGPDNLLFFECGDDSPDPCIGLSYDWNRPAASLSLRVPARCVAGGNYGAVRTWALIEGFRSSSSDVDYAPETPNGDLRFTRWLARG